MITNPLEGPKRALLWGLDSSLRSRVAHTEPIFVAAPPGQGGPRGPERPIFHGDSQNRNFGGDISKKTTEHAKKPFGGPKEDPMVVLKVEPQLTTRTHGANIGHGTMGPEVPGGPEWDFFNGTRKIENWR